MTIDSIRPLALTAVAGAQPMLRDALPSDVRVTQDMAARIVGSELRGPYVGAGRSAAIAPLWPVDAAHGGGLLAQARANGTALAARLGVAHDPVAVGRLERAALDFGREARALFIGGIDWTPTQLTHFASHALGSAAARAAALPDVGLTPTDRAIAFLEHATRTLVDAPHLSPSAPV